MDPDILRGLAKNEVLMEVGRMAIEDTLIDMRDSRIFVLRNNGLVCREKDGTTSSTIRLGPENAVIIALNAIADHISKETNGPQ